MVKRLSKKELERKRIRNIKKWSSEDYKFYKDTFKELLGADEPFLTKAEEKAYDDASFKRFQKFIKEFKKGKKKK